MRLRHLRAFLKAPGQSKFVATTAFCNSEGTNRNSDEEFLLKLRTILLGNKSASPAAETRPVENNAALLSRLKGILVQEQDEQPINGESIHRKDHPNVVLYKLGKQGNFSAAKTSCQQMAQKGCVPDLLCLCEYAEQLAPLVQLPKGWDSNVPMHSHVMIALCKAGKFLDAQRAVMAILKQGMEVDILVLNTLVYGLCKAGFKDQSFGLVQEMVNRGFSPDLLDEGVGLVDRICTAFDSLLGEGSCPDVVFYTALVDGLCKVDKVAEALYLVKFSAPRISFAASTCKALVDRLMKDQPAETVATNEHILQGFDSLQPVDYESKFRQLCYTGKLSEATEYLVDMRKTDRIRNVEAYDRLVSHLCAALVEKKAYDLLEALTEKLEPRCTSTYNILIDALCTSGRLEDAYMLLRLMQNKGYSTNNATFIPLLNKLCDKNMAEDAWLLVQEMSDEDYEASCRVSNLVLQTFYKTGNLEEATGVVDWMLGKGFAPDASSYNALIQGCCKAGNVEQGVMLYNEMFQRGTKLDLGTYNALLAGLWGSGKTKEGLVLFRQMVRKSMIPDDTTCSIIIDGLCKEGKIDVAFKVLQLAPGLGCRIGFPSYKTVLNALCDQGDINQARLLLNEMIVRGRDPDADMYEVVFLRWEESSGTESELQDLFRDMLSRNVTPSHSTCRAVLTRLCESGKLEEASYIVRGLLKMELDGSVYRPYIVSLCKSGRVDEARRFFEEDMNKSTSFLAALLEAGLVTEARDSYAKMMRQGHDSCSIMVDVVSSLKGEVSTACKFIREIMKDDTDNRILQVVDQLVKTGKLIEAAQVFTEMAMSGIISCTSDSWATLTRLMDVLVQAKEASVACHLLEGVLQVDDLCKQEHCQRLVHDLLKAGEVSAAYRALEETIRRKSPVGILDAILREFCKLGKYEEAASALGKLHAKGLLQAKVA